MPCQELPALGEKIKNPEGRGFPPGHGAALPVPIRAEIADRALIAPPDQGGQVFVRGDQPAAAGTAAEQQPATEGGYRHSKHAGPAKVRDGKYSGNACGKKAKKQTALCQQSLPAEAAGDPCHFLRGEIAPQRGIGKTVPGHRRASFRNQGALTCGSGFRR